MTTRGTVFVAIVFTCVLGVGLYLRHALDTAARGTAETSLLSVLPSLDPAMLDAPHVIFARQAARPDRGEETVGIASLSDPTKYGFIGTLRCVRVHMSQGRGVCLERRGRFPVRYFAKMFDASFVVVGELELAGAPSRVQVSPSGRLAAVTVFVTGHAYSDGAFSTQTSIIDLDRRTWRVEDMETLDVRRNGQPFRSADFNFWGVTFMEDGRTFLATLGSGDRTYLVRGDLEARTMEVVADDVECPSLSPDNRRIAFKHRITNAFGPAGWQIWVMDLTTGERHALMETRNVDDQAQWLDDDTVLYAIADDKSASSDTWAIPADGKAPPHLFLPSSLSAAVVRP